MQSLSENPQQFRGALEKFHGNGLNWTILRIPFSVEKIWGVRGVFRVHVDVNRYEFTASLLPTGKGEHYLIVNKKIQKAARIVPGTSAIFRVAPDRTPRELKTPAELERALSEDRALKKWFEGLNRGIKKWLIDMIAKTESSETRKRRADRIAEQLMEAMEAEQELPPMIRLFFNRNPEAKEIWDRLTPLQRRANLIAIFHYRTPQSRLRRLEKFINWKAGKEEVDSTNSPPKGFAH
jgi:uncharacterized protein YdeI (YjbR/CyaY-like superfamily)